jgi:hypothetical protein
VHYQSAEDTPRDKTRTNTCNTPVKKQTHTQRANAHAKKVFELRKPEEWTFPSNHSVLDLNDRFEGELQRMMCDTYLKDNTLCKVYNQIDNFVSYKIGDKGLLWQDDNAYG